MKKLPVLISIPHGGMSIPEEVENRIMISKIDIFDDSDAFTQQIYDIENLALFVIKTNTARAFVDQNRSIHQLPPKYPDGVIKSHTCHGKKIYRIGKEPDQKLIQILLHKYYQSYHEKLKKKIIDLKDELEIILDCHSMNSKAPAISKDKGEKRPLICLGNLNGQTCNKIIMNHLAKCLCQSFGIKASEISFNKPFAGGYITQTYGFMSIPLIQIELSKALYFIPPYYKHSELKIDSKILSELNEKFKQALSDFFSNKLP